MSDPRPAPAPITVDICEMGRYNVVGMDAIWHNMYCYPDHPEKTPEGKHPFMGLRAWRDEDADGIVKLVASHVELGMYSLISISASKHGATVVVASTKYWEDFPEGAFAGVCRLT